MRKGAMILFCFWCWMGLGVHTAEAGNGHGNGPKCERLCTNVACDAMCVKHCPEECPVLEVCKNDNECGDQAACIDGACVTANTEVCAETLCGDINNNGAVSAFDALATLRIAVGLEQPISGTQCDFTVCNDVDCETHTLATPLGAAEACYFGN